LDVTLCIKKYTPSEKGVIDVPAGSVWKVWPRYTMFVGHLVHLENLLTVAVLDEANRFVPVTVRMTTEEAEQFAARLLETIAERKRLDSDAG
jgi:hypothetical protein